MVGELRNLVAVAELVSVGVLDHHRRAHVPYLLISTILLWRRALLVAILRWVATVLLLGTGHLVNDMILYFRARR